MAIIKQGVFSWEDVLTQRYQSKSCHLPSNQSIYISFPAFLVGIWCHGEALELFPSTYAQPCRSATGRGATETREGPSVHTPEVY